MRVLWQQISKDKEITVDGVRLLQLYRSSHRDGEFGLLFLLDCGQLTSGDWIARVTLVYNDQTEVSQTSPPTAAATPKAARDAAATWAAGQITNYLTLMTSEV